MVLLTSSNLSALTSGAPSDATVALDTTYSGGAQPTKISGVPALPTQASISPANYPGLDVIPPTDSAQVQDWLKAIDFSKVPNYNVTDGTVSILSNREDSWLMTRQCAGTPGAITDGRCWWTCGGCSESLRYDA